MKKVIIGTRGSALALKQTEIAKEALLAVDPKLEIEVLVIKTEGDVNQSPIPLDTVGKGWFTKEIERELVAGRIDLAVHSLKDLAEEMPEGLMIGAYLPREDARDALVVKTGSDLSTLKPRAIVGTDSIRRKVQALALRPDLDVESVRGNVQTRLEKLARGKYDAIILAAAGLKRLGIENKISQYFSIQQMTPAPGQGILAVQVRVDDAPLSALLKKANDADAAHVAKIERTFSKIVGGGCKAPVGAYAWREGKECKVIGMLQNKDGKVVRAELSAPWEKSDDLGEKLAAKLGNG